MSVCTRAQASFPFGIKGRMWDLTILIPDVFYFGLFQLLCFISVYFLLLFYLLFFIFRVYLLIGLTPDHYLSIFFINYLSLCY